MEHNINESLNPEPELWPQLAPLKLSLFSHIECHSQVYRQQRWYVFNDLSTGKNIRFNKAVYQFIIRLTGKQSLASILGDLSYENESKESYLDKITLIDILKQLIALNFVDTGLPIDVKLKLEAHHRSVRRQRLAVWTNPLAIKVPLLNPDSLLTVLSRKLAFLLSSKGLYLWCLMICLGFVTAMLEQKSLAQHFNNTELLGFSNLISMAIAFVFLKFFHELAHGVAAKKWGLVIPELGINFLIFMPLPYVDCSNAWVLNNKYKRMAISAAGISFELFVACITLFIWLTLAPGLIKDFAFNIMLIGGVSSLVFNGNPLLRFDGYHILQDFVEIPNLYSRANKYYMYLLQRYILGIESAESPITAHGEKPWFVFYGLAALVYRYMILAVIVVYLCESYLVLGAAVAVWAMYQQLFKPLLKAMWFLAKLIKKPKKSGRSLLGLFSVACFVLLVLFAIPLPLQTQLIGVSAISEQGQIFSPAAAIVEEVYIEAGAKVSIGQPMFKLAAPQLEYKIALTKAKIQELQARHYAEVMSNRHRSDVYKGELVANQAELLALRERQRRLLVHSLVEGDFVLANNAQLQGQAVKRGQLLAYVVNPEALIVKAVITNDKIDLVRSQAHGISIRLASTPWKSYGAKIISETPAGSNRLPSAALSVMGGGEIRIRNDKDSGLLAVEKIFVMELSTEPNAIKGLGERAYIRVEHGHEVLFLQLYRTIRRIFLNDFWI